MAEVARLLAPHRPVDGGSGFMPWQRHVHDVAGEIDPVTGRFHYPIVVQVVPRQAGKTLGELAKKIQRAQLGKRRRGWYTMQTQKAAAELFTLEWVPMVQESRNLHRLLSVRQSVGSWRFTSRATGSTIGLFEPGPTCLHSKQADDVTVDEAWAFTLAQGHDLETGIRPAQITRPQRQLWIVSAGGKSTSTWLQHYIDLGRQAVEAGERANIAYFEWSAADDIADVDIYDPAVWRATHPAIGYTIGIEALEAEAATMSPSAFARSYLNIPEKQITDRVIGDEDWQACIDIDSKIAGPVCFGVDIALDRSAAAVAAAGWRDDGLLHVEVIAAQHGTSWLVPWLTERCRRWQPLEVVVDGYGPARGLTEPLARAGIDVTVTNAGQMASAAGDFYDDVVRPDGTVDWQPRLRHRAQGILDQAVAGAGKRPIGDAWTWGRRASATTDISPLVAATLARWASAHHPVTSELATIW